MTGARHLICIPGFMLDRDLWSDVETLLPPDCQVHHVDPRAATSVEDMALQILTCAPGQFTLIGFSMGGYVAREVVRLAPEKVKRLILIATSARPVPSCQIAALPPTTWGGIGRAAIRRSLAASREGEEVLVERIRQMGIRLGSDTFARQMSFHRSGDADRLDAIQCPTLIVAGSEDRLRSIEEAEGLRQGISGSQLIVLPAGHMIPLEVPGLLAVHIQNFLPLPG